MIRYPSTDAQQAAVIKRRTWGGALVLSECRSGGAGIADVSDSARGSATGFPSHLLSYGARQFTAMAVNRAVSSHLDWVGLTLGRMPGLVLAPCRVQQAGTSTPNPACFQPRRPGCPGSRRPHRCSNGTWKAACISGCRRWVDAPTRPGPGSSPETRTR